MKWSVNFLFFTCCTCMIMLHYFLFNTSVSSLHKMFYSAVNVACHKKVQASNSKKFILNLKFCLHYVILRGIHPSYNNEQQNNSTWHPQWYRCVCQLGHQLITSEENHYTFWQNNRDYHEDPSNVAYNLDKYCHRGCFGVLH